MRKSQLQSFRNYAGYLSPVCLHRPEQDWLAKSLSREFNYPETNRGELCAHLRIFLMPALTDRLCFSRQDQMQITKLVPQVTILQCFSIRHAQMIVSGECSQHRQMSGLWLMPAG